LFDEPLSNLDARLRLQMRVEIRTLLKRAGLSAIYVTHDQSEASVVADRTAVMNQGRIEQIGPWAELYHRPATRFVAEFMSNGNVLKGRVDSVDDDGCSVILSGRLGLVRVALRQGAQRPAIDQPIEVYCPREAIKLEKPRAGEPGARVQTILPGAGLFEILLSLPDETQLIAIVLADGDPPSAGDALSVRLDERRLSGFAAT
jgi:ABC-type Fe3+/spermidine/putrescine transport system ATPase subunit